MPHNITLYQLSPYIDPKIKEYGMYEFFGMVNGPDPKNYLKVWECSLSTDDLEKIYGHIRLDRTGDYRLKPLDTSDVISVDGNCYFLDCDGFHEVKFDAEAVKPAIHVTYGYGVSTHDAIWLPNELHTIADELDIPYGYSSLPDYHGSHKGESSFKQGKSITGAGCFLHPEFLRDVEAREFIDTLSELTKMENWPDILADLKENRPVYMTDLAQARDKFTKKLTEAALRQQRDIETIAGALSDFAARYDNWEFALAGLLHGAGISEVDIYASIEETNENMSEQSPSWGQQQ